MESIGVIMFEIYARKTIRSLIKISEKLSPLLKRGIAIQMVPSTKVECEIVARFIKRVQDKLDPNKTGNVEVVYTCDVTPGCFVTFDGYYKILVTPTPNEKVTEKYTCYIRYGSVVAYIKRFVVYLVGLVKPSIDKFNNRERW